MVESKTRKSVFLAEAIRHLPLPHASVETARFEELLSRPDLHEGADLLTVRAVRVETRTLMTLQAFLKPTGAAFLVPERDRSSAALRIFLRRSGGPPPIPWSKQTAVGWSF